MNNEDKILSLLEVIVTKVDTLEQGLTRVEQSQTKLEQSQARLEQNQAKLEQSQARLEQNQGKLEQGQARLELEVKEIKQKVSHIEIVIEAELKRDLRIVAENHLSLNQKLDKIKDVNEKILSLQDDTTILKSITKNTLYDLEVLKAAK